MRQLVSGIVSADDVGLLVPRVWEFVGGGALPMGACAGPPGVSWPSAPGRAMERAGGGEPGVSIAGAVVSG